MTIGEDIIAGLEHALAHAKGERPGRETRFEVPVLDVRRLRTRLGLTQTEFAARYGFSVGAVRNWEQGTRRPERAARLLLAVIDRDPDLVHETLADLAAPAP